MNRASIPATSCNGPPFASLKCPHPRRSDPEAGAAMDGKDQSVMPCAGAYVTLS